MRKEFENLPDIRKIMNENGIYFMNHSGWYEARDFKDFEYEQYINGAWYAWQAAKAQAVPEGFILMPKVPTEHMVNATRGKHEGAPYLPYSIYEAFVEQATIEAQEQTQ